MGLDMYLTGKRTFMYGNEGKDEEGYDIKEIHLKLGYWRKHPNLHGYIVHNYADGEDDCRDISLDEDALIHLLEIVKDPSQMPKTEGFFFGKSSNDDEQIKHDTEIFTRALAFIHSKAVTGNNQEWRDVIYRASW